MKTKYTIKKLFSVLLILLMVASNMGISIAFDAAEYNYTGSSPNTDPTLQDLEDEGYHTGDFIDELSIMNVGLTSNSNFSIDVDGNELKSWSSDYRVYYIYLKSGSGGGSLFVYNNGAFENEDGELMEVQSGKDISHITFYYSVKEPKGSVTIDKVLQDDKGNLDKEFEIIFDGTSYFISANDIPVSIDNLSYDTYTISESIDDTEYSKVSIYADDVEITTGEIEIDSETNIEIVVTNSYDSSGTITVTKEWLGLDNDEVYDGIVTVYIKDSEDAIVDTLELSDPNWEDVSIELNLDEAYTIDEQDLVGFTESISDATVTLTEDEQNIDVTVTNTKIIPPEESGTITVTKEWLGLDNDEVYDGIVTVYIKDSEDAIVDTLELSDPNWEDVSIELDLDEAYTIDEQDLVGFTESISDATVTLTEDEQNIDVTVTNTKIIPPEESGTITVTKEWLGLDNDEVYDGIVTVYIKDSEDAIVDTLELSDPNWEDVSIALDLDEAYTIDEQDLVGFTESISDETVTLITDEQNIDVTVTNTKITPPDESGTITITKQVTNRDSSPDFTINLYKIVEGEETEEISYQLSDGESTGSIDLSFGDYRVIEMSEPNDYDFVNIKVGSETLGGGYFTLNENNSTIDIVVNNEYNPDDTTTTTTTTTTTRRTSSTPDRGELTVIKQVEDEDGNSLNDDETVFTIDIFRGSNLVGRATLSDGESKTWELVEGEYTIEETDIPDGYRLDGIGSGGTVNIDSNDDITITVTNVLESEEVVITTPATPEAAPEVPVIEEEPAEIILDEAVPQAPPALPQTGEFPPYLFYGLGGMISALGIKLRKKNR